MYPYLPAPGNGPLETTAFSNKTSVASGYIETSG
jgi:hypothetical protein